ncbi:MAG: transglutaminase-like cysteine peptidase [Desulfovibrio sp.]|nr:transglutaminase-like cysteine peptidase [Desulfovibrio sp.]
MHLSRLSDCLARTGPLTDFCLRSIRLLLTAFLGLVLCAGHVLCAETGNDDKEKSPKGTKIQLFNTVEFKRPLSSLPAWMRLLDRNNQASIFVDGKSFSKSETWNTFKDGAKGKKGLDLLRYVHNFWNKFPYREDILNWGVDDYWAIPDEFLKKSGDCEDYAIIKYFSLRQLGLEADKMRIVVLRDTVRNLAHAVLVVYMDNDAYVLDNLSSAVLSHTRFKHYQPQYSVNELGRWAHLKGRPAQPAAAAAKAQR